ncbi:hypothetical protein GCM10009602_50080 [Nocardiopsis tropica]
MRVEGQLSQRGHVDDGLAAPLGGQTQGDVGRADGGDHLSAQRKAEPPPDEPGGDDAPPPPRAPGAHPVEGDAEPREGPTKVVTADRFPRQHTTIMPLTGVDPNISSLSRVLCRSGAASLPHRQAAQWQAWWN